MERTHKELFAVLEPDNSSVFSSPTNTHLWFEVLEGEDEGIRVRVPLFRSSYDEEVENTLRSLSDGDVVRAVLEREGPSDSWEPVELEIVD